MIVNKRFVKTSSILSKSNLPTSDFCINPYVGCPHGCKYCYATFMRRFTNHENEPWGSFVDIKQWDKDIDINKLKGKTVFLSSVTDCYNPVEAEVCSTRKILENIVDADAEVTITTKSNLVLRDIDLFKKFKNITIAFSINTLDEKFKTDMDNASSIQDRISALKTLHENNVRTVLFMSPIFPEITDFKEIINKTKLFVDEFWFENLNLRAGYKYTILNYIKKNYKNLYPLYNQIYNLGDYSYWDFLAKQIDEFCIQQKLNFKNYFHHEKIRKNN